MSEAEVNAQAQTPDTDTNDAFSEYPFNKGDHALVDWSDGMGPNDRISGEVVSIGGTREIIVSIKDHDHDPSQLYGDGYDAAPEWIIHSFNIAEAAASVGYQLTEGEEMPGHTEWTVAKTLPHRITFESTGQLSVAIEQVKPDGYDLPFRVRSSTDGGTFTDIEMADHFDEALRLAVVFSKGASTTTGIDF